MIYKSDNNFYEFKRGTKYICLIDKMGSISGATMKQCNFRAPEEVKVLKNKILEFNPSLGSCYKTFSHFFIVARNNYHCKWDINIFEQIWKSIVPLLAKQNYDWHLDVEDYPWIEEVVKKYDIPELKLTLYHHCEW